MKKQLFAFILLTVLLFTGMAHAYVDELPTWLGYTEAQAQMIWEFSDDQGNEVAQGDFYCNLPDKFAFINTDQSRRVLGYQGLTAIYSQGRVAYGYEPFRLFALIQQVLRPVMLLPEEPSQWWRKEFFPILAKKGFSVAKYVVGADEALLRIELNFEQPDLTGVVELSNVDGKWFPTRIEMIEGTNTARLTFANWHTDPQTQDFTTLDSLHQALLLGEAAFTDENWGEAVTHFQQVIRIDPYYIPGYFYLAYSYGIEGHYLGAVESYEQWLMLEPDNALAMNNLAYTYLLQEVNLSEALRMAELAVATEPLPAFIDTLGYAYYMTGDYQRAAERFHEALAGIEESMVPEVYRHLIKTYEKLGEWDQVKYYQEALDQLVEELP